MRLTDEQIMDIKEYLNRSIKITISSLIPRISKHGLDLIDTIEALQQENEQLRAQVARMRELLEKAREALKGVNVVRCPYCWGKETHSDKCEISKAIETIDKVIGGKEDEKTD